jgi:hypothetical protein
MVSATAGVVSEQFFLDDVQSVLVTMWSDTPLY